MKPKEIANHRAKPLSDATPLLALSVSSDVERLARLLPAILGWIQNHASDFAVIIGDHLQLHNELVFEARGKGEAADQISEKSSRLREVVSAISSRPIIMTSEIVSETSFAERYTRFGELYEGNREFQSSVDEGIFAYLKRREVEVVRGDQIWQHCVAYQLEELAIYELLTLRGFDALIYPGPQLPVMKALVEERLPDVSSALEVWKLVELRAFER